MKQFNLFKNLFFVALLFATGIVNAQVHPLGFGPHTLSGGGTTLSASNWYADYVGARLVVTNPAPVAGQYNCTSAIIGASDWPDIVWPAGGIVNVPIVMQAGCDSFGGTALGTSCTGKIAVIWRGPIAGGCFSGTTYPFTQKAEMAQNAGAVAIVIINEYPGQAATIPGFSTGFGSIHIPVVMIGNLDGIAISGAYHTNPAGTVKMSITPWGLGNANDLGLITNGEALYQYYAIPKNQLVAGNSSLNYLGMDGAFVANFGSHIATNTKLVSTLSFTPTGGSTTVEHQDSLIFAGNFAGAANVPATTVADTSSDSVMAMFSSSSSDEYSLAASTTGRYDLKYTVSSDSVDQYPGDNTSTSSFYVTDTLFSRGRYDFTKNVPLSNTYEAYSNATEMTWGDYFYVANSGYHIANIQYNVSNGRTTGANDLIGNNDIYVFSWTDGSNGQPADSLVQDGELDLVSWTTHAFVSGVDTSMATITQKVFNDSADLLPVDVNLAANTWYYVAIDLPAASTDTLFLGVDGVNNAFPRIFGRWWDHGQTYLDYSNTVGTNASTFTSNLAQAEAPLPFTQVSFVNVVDSFSWTSVNGLVPSIALNMTNHVDTTSTSHVGVNNQMKSNNNITIFPNPASDRLNVSVNLDHSAPSITYKIIDATGRAVSKQTHNNVLNETFGINTSAMPAGTYFLLISADGQVHTSKKFTVIK